MSCAFRIWLSLLFFCTPIFANETQVITGLIWKPGPQRILREVSGGAYLLLLEGFYRRPGWKLFLGENVVVPKREGDFAVMVPSETHLFTANFTAKGPSGEIETEFVAVTVNDVMPPLTKKKVERGWLEQRLRALSLDAGIGTTFLSYQQANFSSISEMSLTPQIDFSYSLEPHVWRIDAGLFASLLSLTKAEAVGDGVKIYGFNSHLGYELPFSDRTWTLFVFGGFYYLSSFGSPFIGFRGIAGPELFPAFRKEFESGTALVLAVKYSPIFNGFSLLSLSNRHLCAAVSYYLRPFSWSILRGVPLGFTLEYSQLSLPGLSAVDAKRYTLSAHLMF